MARLVGKMRADLRAMEIQANDPRTNPIRGGAGATPSMGLSQFRGGAVPDHISAAPRRVVGGAKHPIMTTPLTGVPLTAVGAMKMASDRADKQRNRTRKADFDKFNTRNVIIQPRGVGDSGDMLGLRHGDRNPIRLPDSLPSSLPYNGRSFVAAVAARARGARGSGGNESESDEEVDGGAHHGESASRMGDATAMGLHLGQHLHSLHGAGFFSRFKRGFSKVGKTLAKGAKKGLAVVKKVNDFREKHIEPVVRKALPYFGPKGAMLEKALKARDVVKGLTTMLPEGKAKNVIKAVGFGGSMYPSGQYEGQGRESDDIATISAGSKMDKKLAKYAKAGLQAVDGGKKRRAPAGASDGRRKRAEIVKKVMAEKGLKMIEASKYVKAHNLY